MAVIKIESQDQFTKLTSENDPNQLITLYFNTPWASPCIQMNTVYELLSEANPSTLFISIDAEKYPQISELLDVTAVPYFVLIKNGTILKELSGADPKEFVSALNEFSGPQSNSDSSAKATSAATASASNSTAPTSTNGLALLLSSQSKQQPPQDNATSQEETPEQLNERLKKLTNAAPVMLFMKGTPASPQCGFSRQLVAILREHQVRFGFFDILKDDAVRQGLKTFSDWPTFPQLYIKGEFQGGLDIIKESIEDDPEFFSNAVSV